MENFDRQDLLPAKRKEAYSIMRERPEGTHLVLMDIIPVTVKDFIKEALQKKWTFKNLDLAFLPDFFAKTKGLHEKNFWEKFFLSCLSLTEESKKLQGADPTLQRAPGSTCSPAEFRFFGNPDFPVTVFQAMWLNGGAFQQGFQLMSCYMKTLQQILGKKKEIFDEDDIQPIFKMGFFADYLCNMLIEADQPLPLTLTDENVEHWQKKMEHDLLLQASFYGENLQSPKAVKPQTPKAVKPQTPKAVKPQSPKAVTPAAVKPQTPKAVKPAAVSGNWSDVAFQEFVNRYTEKDLKTSGEVQLKLWHTLMYHAPNMSRFKESYQLISEDDLASLAKNKRESKFEELKEAYLFVRGAVAVMDDKCPGWLPYFLANHFSPHMGRALSEEGKDPMKECLATFFYAAMDEMERPHKRQLSPEADEQPPKKQAKQANET